MPDIQRLNPDTMSKPTGYMHVVKTGNTVYIAGQIATAPDGSVVGKGDAEAQVRQIWKNIEAAIKSVGGNGISNLVKTTTYVTDIAHAGAVRKVREELFSSTQPPTSTLLVISELAGPAYLVEIEAIAVVD